jgi:hypothetical protein
MSCRPVIVEVPHFASLRGGEREISIRRSDGGRLWKDAAPPLAKDEYEKRKAVIEVIKAIDTGLKYSVYPSCPRHSEEPLLRIIQHTHNSLLFYVQSSREMYVVLKILMSFISCI